MILKSFVDAGLPAIPCLDKNNPLLRHGILDKKILAWHEYTTHQQTAPAVALKTGNQQTQIECIDFDLKNDDIGNLWDDYCQQADLTGLYIEDTPSGGKHIMYRRETEVPGSEKLAYPEKGKSATIETRGKGGYVVVAPSPGYKATQGDIMSLPIIPNARAEELKSIARSFNCQPKKKIYHSQQSPLQRVYNQKHVKSIHEYLLSKNWKIYKEKEDRIYYTRPGKDKGTSATLFLKSGYFYVFTNALETFQMDQAYTPFDLMCITQGMSPDDAEREIAKTEGQVYAKDVVCEILCNRGKLKEVEIVNALKKTIIEDMEKRGCFYNDGAFGYYFTDRKIIHVDYKTCDGISAFVYETYGMVSTQPKASTIFEAIQQHAQVKGKSVKIHNYSHYTGDAVYVDNFNGYLWKITDKDIDYVDNGTDGILFTRSDCENISVMYDDKAVNMQDVLFDGLVFDEEYLTRDDQIKLCFFWVLSIYFMKDVKPILCAVGEKGSGKSFLFKKILRLLFGNQNKIATVPEKPDDFWTIVTNNKLMIYDNADTHRLWLNDALAVCATGGNVQMRTLFKTNVPYRAKINCFLGLTSRTPSFTRDDVSDRLLILKLETQKTFRSEEKIYSELDNVRNAFMSNIFETIKRVISCLKNPDKVSTFRMADFENFCVKIDNTSEEIFDKLMIEQKEFSEDSFTDLLKKYCKESVLEVFTKSASDIRDELSKVAREMGFTRMNLTSKSVAHLLKRKYSFCEIKKISLPSGNKAEWEIKITCQRKESF